MQKAMVWAAVAVLIACGGQVSGVNGEEPEAPQDERAEIQIRVGRNLIDDPNKEKIPIPEFEYGVPFMVEVEWVDPIEGLTLTLSDFRLVSLNPCADDDRGGAVWEAEDRYSLELGNGGEVVFSIDEAEKMDKRRLVTRKEVTIGRVEAKTPRTIPRPQLILFKKTVSDKESGVLFAIDPPWVGKPPVG